MAEYVLSPRAQKDIDEIWDYTVKRWGVRQARIYILQVKAAIEVAATNRYAGRPCDDIRTGYLKYSAGSHILFYRRTDAGINVIRILHQQMDFNSHL